MLSPFKRGSNKKLVFSFGSQSIFEFLILLKVSFRRLNMATSREISQYTVLTVFTMVLYMTFVQTNFVKANFVQEECFFCESYECLYQANIFLKYMNPNAQPCQDFYSFACGGYLDQFGKEDTRSIYDDTWNNFLIRIKNLLENLKPNTGTVSEKLKDVYDSCMNQESSEIMAVPDALNFLSYVGIPNWPVLDSDFQFDQLSETLGSLSVYGEFAFITFQPSPYEKKSGRSAFPSPLILPDKFLMDSKLKIKDIQKAVLKILSYFGFDAETSESQWENFKSVEKESIKLQNEEATNNTACTSDSSRLYTKVNCSIETQGSMAFLCNIWKIAVEKGKLEKYYSTETLHISCRWNHYIYIQKIFSYLSSTLDQRSLAHYLSLRFFISHLDDLNLYFQLIKKSFTKPKDLDDKTTDTVHRMEYCIGWIIKSMHLALGYEYTQRFAKEQMEHNVLNIVHHYVEELSNSIDSQHWINEKVISYLKKQLRKLDIGFKKSMKSLRNETAVSNYYKEFVPVKGRSFLKTILEYTKSSVPTKKENINFNSFYSSSDSYTMDFGLSLLLPPTYSYGLPKILNYATLGWIIGHELSHNLKFFFDMVFLDEETENNLNNRLKCYVNQYSQFIMEKNEKGISSKEAEEEIVADNIGWALTEKIIKSFNYSDITINLPGLQYHPLQLMYISLAQESCAALSKQVEEEFYKSKPQNIQKLRVLSILQNSKTFSEIFNCPEEQTMNPREKCVFFD